MLYVYIYIYIYNVYGSVHMTTLLKKGWVLDSEAGNRFWEFMLKMKINWNWLEKKDLEKPIGENFRILILIHLPEVDLLKTLLNDEFPSRQNFKKIKKKLEKSHISP